MCFVNKYKLLLYLCYDIFFPRTLEGALLTHSFSTALGEDQNPQSIIYTPPLL